MAIDIQPKDSTSEVDKIAKDIHVESEKLERGKRIPKPAGVNKQSRILWSYVLPVIVISFIDPGNVYLLFQLVGIVVFANRQLHFYIHGNRSRLSPVAHASRIRLSQMV